MAEYINNDIAMSWDDEIANDSEFVLLPEGDYDFMVVDFERKRFEGSAKISPCPQASLAIKLFDRTHPEKGSTTINHNLFLNRKCEGLLCAFFTSIGDRKHGESLRPNWNAVKGKGGRCKVGVREWTSSKDGSTKQSNEILKFYEPKASSASVTTPTTVHVQKPFIPGKF